jgi:hypothetical protein
MSTIENLVSWRKSFERTAALLLSIATTVVVAGGAVLMCAEPFVS